MSKPIGYEVQIQRYNGPKQVNMAKSQAKNIVLPLKVLAKQIVSQARVNQVKKACPEYHGYNTARFREEGRELGPKTDLEYKPLIDMNPADPDTIMTALVKSQELMHLSDQKFTVLHVIFNSTKLHKKSFGHTLISFPMLFYAWEACTC